MSESITLTISIFRFRIVPTEIRTQILSEKKKTHLARSECCPPPPLAPSRRRFLLLFWELLPLVCLAPPKIDKFSSSLASRRQQRQGENLRQSSVSQKLSLAGEHDIQARWSEQLPSVCFGHNN